MSSASHSGVGVSRSPEAGAAVMRIDAHTLRDLEVFDSHPSGRSLFEYCNFTRTDGGARALRRRMERPWASASDICATQRSLTFIIENREVFDRLPKNFITSRVEHYLRDVLPTIEQGNYLEFAAAVISSWSNHDRHHFKIVLGVKMTCQLLHLLRQFVSQIELDSAAGEIVSLIKELKLLLNDESLMNIPKNADNLRFLKTIRLNHLFRVPERQTLSRILSVIYEVDALVALADATIQHELVIPRVDEAELHVLAEDLVHPFVANAVANPVELDQKHPGLFLTGPNMAGKTTYLRAFATALYLAHLGMGVPARTFRFAPVERLFSSLSLKDSLHEGVSYFRAEALRVRDIAEAVVFGYRVVAIMDEPFKGTNIQDASEATLAILNGFSNKQNCLFMFSSHQIEISGRLTTADSKIQCRCFTAIETEDRLRFDFKLRDGVSQQRIGMRVLREEGVLGLLAGS